VEGRQAFGPYGERIPGEPHTMGYAPLTGYTGHLHTEPSGLVYMKARFYSPAWHRFLNPDWGVDALSWNQFAYAGGSPFHATDPTGLMMSSNREGSSFPSAATVGSAIPIPPPLPHIPAFPRLTDPPPFFAPLPHSLPDRRMEAPFQFAPATNPTGPMVFSNRGAIPFAGSATVEVVDRMPPPLLPHAMVDPPRFFPALPPFMPPVFAPPPSFRPPLPGPCPTEPNQGVAAPSPAQPQIATTYVPKPLPAPQPISAERRELKAHVVNPDGPEGKVAAAAAQGDYLGAFQQLRAHTSGTTNSALPSGDNWNIEGHFEYSQSSGRMTRLVHYDNPETGECHIDEIRIGYGYSGINTNRFGHNPTQIHGRNNPEEQCSQWIGPLPIGGYIIGEPFNSEHTGPYSMRLIPNSTNDMCGRSSFLIHGDSTTHPGEASEGCIILDRASREAIGASEHNRLRVIP